MKRLVISGKPVFIVTKHHAVLQAWAEIRRTRERPPILITLDHHTDTRVAFTHHLYSSGQYRSEESVDKLIDLVLSECRKIDWANGHTLVEAVLYLAHDEHIDAAIRSGIIDHAYVISFSGGSGTPRRGLARVPLEERLALFAPIVDEGLYERPDRRIFELKSGCAIGCSANPHDDRCHVEHSSQVIESVYLSEKLTHVSEMSQAFGVANVLAEPFVLDIDLDYFHSRKSISPDDSTVFYDLIRKSIAITIATEPTYVEMERLPGETITADFLLTQLLEHIRRAQNP